MNYFLRVCIAPVLFTGTFLPAALNAAPPVSNSMTIEEDWEMRVNTVESTVKVCPQWITNFPLGNGYYFVSTFNFRDYPSVEFGGIQLQVWHEADSAPMYDTEIILNKVDYNNDVLRWKQVIKTNGTDCEIKLTGCNSQSWGSNINSQAVTFLNSNIPNLNSYNPAESASSSEVMYGKNRVIWFGIVETRTYDDKGKLITKDTTLRPVVDNTATQ
jgi:hypothetical protein